MANALMRPTLKENNVFRKAVTLSKGTAFCTRSIRI